MDVSMKGEEVFLSETQVIVSLLNSFFKVFQLVIVAGLLIQLATTTLLLCLPHSERRMSSVVFIDKRSRWLTCKVDFFSPCTPRKRTKNLERHVTMEGQRISSLKELWPSLKTTYERIVDNAYTDPIDKETAHHVILRLHISVLDLWMSDDPLVREMIDRLRGAYENPGNTADREDREDGEDREVLDDGDGGDGEEDGAQGKGNEDAAGTEGNETAANHATHGEEAEEEQEPLESAHVAFSGPSLTREELQQIFSFWPSHEHAFNYREHPEPQPQQPHRGHNDNDNGFFDELYD
jgi:hypothetical protein